MPDTSPRSPGLRALDLVFVASFFGAIVWLFLYRADYIDRAFGSEVGCNGCFLRDLVVNDGVYLGSLLFAFVLSLWLRRWLLYVPLRLLAIAGLLVYAADIMVLEQFHSRLNAADVRMYAVQFKVGLGHLSGIGLFTGAWWVIPAALLAWTLLALCWPPQPRRLRPPGAALLALPLAWALMGVALPVQSYVHGWAMRSVVAANMAPGIAIWHSGDVARDALTALERDPPACEPGRGLRPDIVVLILESWSPFQSRLWTGLNDWTPHLDELARRHTMYENFHALGFATNEGLMSLLAGVEIFAPMRGPFSSTAFETAWDLPQTLPRVLGAQGYHAAFLTSGNLGFAYKGEWLRNAGFHHVEGHEHPGYEGAPRHHFESVPDDMLYARALEFVAQRRAVGAPFLVVIENVSSHQPFVHPRTRERNPEAVFRYMDETAHAFVEGLTAQGFFQRDGMLFIASDHRAMVPVSSGESALLGRAAASRIPAVLVTGHQEARRVTQAFHQSDLLPTLTRHVQDEVCARPPRRDLFDPERADPHCLLHTRGDNRDHIDVFCPEGEGTIRLAGDHTRFLDAPGLSPQRQAEVVQRVNGLRISAQLRHGRYLERRARP